MKKYCTTEILKHRKERSDQTAVSDGTVELSYHDLGQRVESLCQHLLGYELPSESIVAVVMQPSIDLVVSLLAIWHAGLTYCPIYAGQITALPRIKKIIQNTQPALTLTNANYPILQTNVFTEQKVVHLADSMTAVERKKPPCQLAPNTRAYILYTSGSTGEPKGVEVEHRGIENCMQQHIDRLKITPKDRFAQFASIGFDAHLVEILVPLMVGGCCVIVPSAIRLDAEKAGKFYHDQQVTCAVFTPSMLRLLSPEYFPTLRVIISTGEKIDQPTLTAWSKQERFFVNGYGPSEVTICTTLAVCDAATGIHIGKPINGLKVNIVENEIVIHGVGLARGYFNNESLTHEKFGLCRIDGNLVRVFKTGDLGFIDNHGNLHITGRIDRQVKIHGKLFHPSEIDEILLTSNLVNNSYSHIAIRENNQPIITTVLKTSTSLTQEDIYSLGRLVHHHIAIDVVPNQWRVVDSWPMSAAGKVDVKAIMSAKSTNYFTHHPIVTVTHEDEVSNIVTRYWHEVLDMATQCSLEDNFFYMGGTSISAAKLIEKLSRDPTLNYQLSLHQFYQTPTLGFLIRDIRRQRKPINTLIKLKHDLQVTSTPALFLVHTLLGTADLDYQEFAQAWNYARKIIGIQAVGLQEQGGNVMSMAELSAIHIKSIQKIQPKGPYFLAGWSFGGILCMEMARQLTHLGHKVHIFALDSYNIALLDNQSKAKFLLKFFEKQFLNVPRFELIKDMSPFEQVRFVSQKLKASANPAQLQCWHDLLISALDYQLEASNFGFELIACASSQLEFGDPYLGWPPNALSHSPWVRQNDNHFSLLKRTESLAWLTKKISNVCDAIEFNNNQQNNFQLPPLFEDFTGRESILSELSEDNSAIIVTQKAKKLTGTGGIGKTQIAICYARNCLQKGVYDMVVWLTAGLDTPGSIEGLLTEQIQTLAHSLGLDTKKYFGVQLAENVFAALSRTYRKCLIVFDNVYNHEIIQPYLPSNDNVKTMITTRQCTNWSGNFHQVYVDIFDESDAVLYIKKVILQKKPNLFNEDEARKLAKKLGYFPLAITQALAYMINRNCSVSEFERLYELYTQKALDYPSLKSDPHHTTVWATVQINLEQIKDSSGALQVIKAMSYLAPELPVDISLLSRWTANEWVCGDIIEQLKQFSLVSDSSVANHVRIHSLVQQILQLGDDEQTKHSRFKQVVNNALEHFKIEQSSKVDEQRRKRLLPHFMIIIEQFASIVSAPNLEEKEYFAACHFNLGNVYGMIGDHKQRLAMLEKSMALYRQIKPEDDSVFFGLYNNLANANGALGDYVKKKDLHELFVRLLTNRNELNTSRYAIALGNLANAYGTLENNEKKRELLERAIAILERIPQHNRLELAKLQNNLASAYMRFELYEKQYECLQKSLKIKLQELGDDHPDVANGLTNLASYFVLTNNIPQAIEHYERALKIKVKAFGPEHYQVAVTLSNYAIAYQHKDETREAVQLMSRALHIFSLQLGDNHPYTVNAKSKLSEFLQEKDELNPSQALSMIKDFAIGNVILMPQQVIQVIKICINLRQFRCALSFVAIARQFNCDPTELIQFEADCYFGIGKIELAQQKLYTQAIDNQHAELLSNIEHLRTSRNLFLRKPIPDSLEALLSHINQMVGLKLCHQAINLCSGMMQQELPMQVLGLLYYQISSCWFYLEDYDKALHFIEQSLEYSNHHRSGVALKQKISQALELKGLFDTVLIRQASAMLAKIEIKAGN